MIDESGIVNRYIVSNYGRVYDIKNDCFVSQVLTGKPQYFYVNYTNDEGKRKLRRVHNLLARTWITNDNPAQYCMVDHIDKNKYIKLYSKNKDILPKDGQSITILSGHLTSYKGNMQIVIYKPTDYRINN
jgi:hypothetical protein